MTDAAVAAIDARTKLHQFLIEKFHEPDLEALDIVFAACRAHYFRSTRPIWLWVVGLSGSGKTEIAIQSICGIPMLRELGQFTSKALMSSKAGKNIGILYTLPEKDDKHTGILCWKDFTSFLSMRREDRTEVMGQFRELADGRWRKDSGERATQPISVRLSIIAACTHALEIAWSVNKNMGERFINVQWHDGDDEQCALKALEHEGQEDEISATVKSLGSKYFGHPVYGETPPSLPASFKMPLVKIALLACWLRRPVHRDEYTRKIDDVPPREKPTRLIKSMRSILTGHSAMLRRSLIEEDLRLAYRVAMDSVSSRRFRIVNVMADDEEFDMLTLQRLSCHARSTLQRELEELEEIGIVSMHKRSEEGVERVYAQLTEYFSQMRTEVLSLFKSPI